VTDVQTFRWANYSKNLDLSERTEKKPRREKDYLLRIYYLHYSVRRRREQPSSEVEARKAKSNDALSSYRDTGALHYTLE
jgi:hypothetical protein